MKQSRKIRTSHRAQSGYALLLIMFMLALLVITMAAAAPTVLSSIQREREKEMVWRGKQYTRGIKLYYLKLNRFPTSLDDLTKPKTGMRFMRQAYKDPMNQVDGSWRLIYVGPNGQLIGSLNQNTIGIGTAGSMGIGGVQGMQGMQGASTLGSSPGFGSSFGGGAFGSSSSFGSGFGSSQLNANNPGGVVTTAPANGSSSSTTNNGSTADGSTLDDPTQPHSLAGPMDASNTIGGNIIGVGSKVDKKSFLIYQKAKNYKLFEFIWDPSKDTTAGRASAGIGTPIQGNTNGMSPAGGTPAASPFSSGMNPGANPQNPGTSQSPSTGAGTGTPDPNQNPPLQAPPNQ